MLSKRKPLMGYVLILVAAILPISLLHAGQETIRAERILAISEQVIPNPEWLESDQWATFTRHIRSPELASMSDTDFAQAFNRAAEDLPFSHFRLQSPSSKHAGNGPDIELIETKHETAILKVAHLSMDQAVMTAMIERLRSGDHHHLILDFRKTPGGAFPAAAALGRFLTRDTIDAGVYLTRRWFAQHGRYPTPEEIARIEPLRELDLDAFRGQLERSGILRIVIPAHDGAIFDGRVYVLTSGRTASAAEALVERIRRLHDRATVIGETTAGAMLSAERFRINERLELFAPVADFMTADGRRLDGAGVRPHIEVPADEALATAHELIAADQRSVHFPGHRPQHNPGDLAGGGVGSD